MAYFKVFSLALIFGCLAVLAENQQQQPNKADKQQQPIKPGNEPRFIRAQDIRLLFNPLISNILTPTTTRAPHPVVVVPQYPYYPYYPNYPYDHEHLTHPTQPTTKPHTIIRPHYPHYPHYPQPPVYPYPSGYPHNAPVHPYYPPYGYDWYGSQYPPFVIVHPPINRTRSIGISNAQFEDEEPQYDLVDGMSARNIKVDGISITSGNSDDDEDSVIVDTKDIKLPYGITLGGFSGTSASHDSSHKKHNEQEALIYLRNYKKGRQLRESKTA